MLADARNIQQQHFIFPQQLASYLCVCVCLRWESRRQKKRERWAFTKFIASDFDAAVTHALPTNHIIQLVCMRVHHLCLYRREGGGTREKAKVNQQKKE